MHFQRVNFVLVCPPVKKNLLHNAVFNAFAFALAEVRSSFLRTNNGPLASKHRNHLKNVITRCDSYRNCESVAPNPWSAGKKDHSSFL